VVANYSAVAIRVFLRAVARSSVACQPPVFTRVIVMVNFSTAIGRLLRRTVRFQLSLKDYGAQLIPALPVMSRWKNSPVPVSRKEKMKGAAADLQFYIIRSFVSFALE